MWDVYTEYLAIQERRPVPAVGAAIGRRAFDSSLERSILKGIPWRCRNAFDMNDKWHLVCFEIGNSFEDMLFVM